MTILLLYRFLKLERCKRSRCSYKQNINHLLGFGKIYRYFEFFEYLKGEKDYQDMFY